MNPTDNDTPDTPKHAADSAEESAEQSAEQPAEQPSEETRIIIREDGEVIIENLTETMTGVALDLDPDSELACRIELAEDDERG